MKNLFLLCLCSVIPFFVVSADQEYSFNEENWQQATNSGNVKLIEEFIQHGVDVNAPTLSKSTPLINTIQSGNIEAVNLLINAGVDLNTIIFDNSGVNNTTKKCAITAAFQYPNRCGYPILELLLQAGADVNIKLYQKRTPLHYAAQYTPGFDPLCLLIEYGAEVNARDLYGRTPLHFCCPKENMLMLIDKGADVNLVDDKGSNPFWGYAYAMRDLEFYKELIARGIPLDDLSSDRNALHWACFLGYDKKAQLNLIKFLIEEQKMNINQHGNWTNLGTGASTPFHNAIISQPLREDDFEVLEYLLNKGANINAPLYYTNNGKIIFQYKSILPWAIDKKMPKYIIEWLRQKGAK